jgi:hypothetical protein
MAGFRWMDKHGWCTGRRQCGSDLAPYVTALSHAHDDHAPLRGKHERHRLCKVGADTCTESGHSRCLNLKGLSGKFQNTQGLRFCQRIAYKGHAGILSAGRGIATMQA